jgi:predicted MFS family arabinose efflux permease
MRCADCFSSRSCGPCRPPSRSRRSTRRSPGGSASIDHAASSGGCRPCSRSTPSAAGVQSLLAFWFHERFGLDEATLGAIFFGANILAAISALAAARIAKRIGLINTMVFTHLPSNVLLMLVPLMPTVELAIVVLLLRFSISQMDVPTRQSYTMAVVDPDERSAAAGVTGIARTTGAALSPLIAAPLFAIPGLASVPFFLAGGLKIVYDLALWRAFRNRPPESGPGSRPRP